MSWLRAITVFTFLLAAFGRPATASAFVASAPATLAARGGAVPTTRLWCATEAEHPDPGRGGRATGIDVYETSEFYNWFVSGVKVVP